MVPPNSLTQIPSLLLIPSHPREFMQGQTGANPQWAEATRLSPSLKEQWAVF